MIERLTHHPHNHIVYRRYTISKKTCPLPEHPNPTGDTHLAALAKALSHPARLRILRLLLSTPGCIGGDIVEAVGLAQSTVSEHLRILKAAGLISGEIAGPRVCYALVPGALTPLAQLVEDIEQATIGAECCVPTEQAG